MGVVFPVYPPDDLAALDRQRREELKAAIRQVLRYDPDVKKLLEDKLPELRELLRAKTAEVLPALQRRGK
jgi:hypothetical protein